MFEMKFDSKGFDKLKKDLDKLQRRSRELEGENSIPFEELFNPSFLSKCTKFSSVDDMFKKSGFTVNNQDDFKKIPDDKWDKFIAENSQFNSWQDMLDKASKEWMENKLFG